MSALSKKIDVSKMDAFRAFLEDVQASAGIMVTTVGYTDGALERAASEGMETWVLRPAEDEDWDGYIRSIQVTMNIRGVVYQECQVELVDGRTFAVSPITIFKQPAKDPPLAIFDRLMNFVRQEHGHTEGKRLRFEVGEPLLFGEGSGASTQVKALSAIPVTEDLLQQSAITTSPHDWVFRRYRPGDEDSDRRFLEIAKLKALVGEMSEHEGPS